MVNSTAPMILQIDDDESNQYAVKKILERAGYQVTSVGTGREGLEKAMDIPDLIILDIRLPDMDGFEVCRIIKSNPLLNSIPVLQTSATFTSSESKVEGLESGADGYLAQPIEGSVLVATVKSLLRIRSAERAAHEATRSREDMLAIVSHDLRNPLAIIMLQSKIMEKQIAAGSFDQKAALDKLRRIHHSCQRMNRLIQDLLDVSSIEEGRLSVVKDRFAGGDLLTEVGTNFEESVKESGIALNLNLPTGDVFINADRERINQILTNLISNSQKFTPQGGKITIGLTQDATHVFFSVTDTGTGIHPAELPHIFNRYWQGHLKRKGGFGLGLSIVKGIVEAHGGHIKARSEVNQGTTITFSLPK